MRVPQRPPADTQDHRPVPAEQCFEGRLIARGPKGFQQLPIRGAVPFFRECDPAQIANDILHFLIPRPAVPSPSYIARSGAAR